MSATREQQNVLRAAASSLPPPVSSAAAARRRPGDLGRRDVGRRSDASRPGCRHGSTPGRPRSRPTATATPISPRFDRLLFFDVLHAPDRERRPPARGVAADARAHLPLGARTGSCSPPAGGRTTSSTSSASARRSRAPKELSDFELPTFDDYDLCLHLACDDEQRLADDRARARPRQAARRPADRST